METNNWLWLIVALLNIVFTIGFWYFAQKKETDKALANQNEKIARLEQDNVTFWRVLGPPLAAVIHSPNHIRRDELVEKFVNGGLPDEEMDELACLLHANIQENHDPAKKLASALLLARLGSINPISVSRGDFDVANNR